jgi:hypothetical protein
MVEYLYQNMGATEDENGFEIKGDINEYFKDKPLHLSTTEDQLEIFHEINQLFLRNQMDTNNQHQRDVNFMRQLNKQNAAGFDKEK